jgi:hypothetical protein
VVGAPPRREPLAAYRVFVRAVVDRTGERVHEFLPHDRALLHHHAGPGRALPSLASRDVGVLAVGTDHDFVGFLGDFFDPRAMYELFVFIVLLLT